MEEELAALAELRMKEESATELSVRLFIHNFHANSLPNRSNSVSDSLPIGRAV